MARLTRTEFDRVKTMLAAVVLIVTLVLVQQVRCFSLQDISSIQKNVSGFLVTRNGQFFLQPVSHNDRSAKIQSDEHHQIENELQRVNEEESWREADEGNDESGLQSQEANHTASEYQKDEDENEIDDDVSWQKRPNSWWQRMVAARMRSRAFSIFGMFETAFNTVSKIVGYIIGDDESEEVEMHSNGIDYKDHQLLRITPKSKKQVRILQELKNSEPDDIKFWTLPAKDKVVDLLVSPGMLSDVKEYLRQKRIKYLILISDLQRVIKSQNPRVPKERRQDLYSSQGHSMTWKRYHRYDDIMGYLDYLADRYPSLVEVLQIGSSFEGRALKILKVSTGANKNGEPKPSIWIDAGMHAREWISTAVATYIINQLVEKNENYTRLLDLTDWIIMPVANPDGYEYTHTRDRLWRKTRSTYESDSDDEDESRQATGILHMLSHYTKWFFGSCEGVDPNRNFNIHWGEDKVGGASSDPCHDTYAGPSPFSEPETRAIASYILRNKDTIKTYLTLHSYSQMLLVPWGFTREKPGDFGHLMNIATKAQKAIAKVSGTEYRVGSAAELLYPTTGSSDDWAKAVAGIKHAYTMELRDRGSYGFLLPASQIVPTARETWAGVRVMARMAALAPANAR